MREILERVGQITRDSQGMLQQLGESERRFRRLAKAVWRVQEEERRRLARELHDGLGQNLTALKNRLETLAYPGGKNPDGTLRTAGVWDAALQAGLVEAAELTGRLLQDTRELSRLLRPPILDDLGLVPALRWLARTMRESTGLDVRLAIDASGLAESGGVSGLSGMSALVEVPESGGVSGLSGAWAAGDRSAPGGASGPARSPAAGRQDAGAGGVDEECARLPADLETLVFRIAQEALTNVAKHSGAAAAEVALRVREGWLALSITDRGAGFDPAALESAAGGAGSGLSGMRDRAELFGGHLRLRAAAGEGTRLEIEVPLPAGGKGGA